jgi:tetratricopeptide (TPR) repeat protein
LAPPVAKAPPTTTAPDVNAGRPIAATAPSALQPIDEALRMFRAGRFADVISRCELIELDDPRNAFAHVLDSHALFALGRFEESAAALGRGLSVLPEEHWAWLIGRYRDFYPPSSYTGLLEKLERYVSENPRDASAHRLLGYHAGMLGQTQSALEHLKAAITLEPNDELSPRLMQRLSASQR